MKKIKKHQRKRNSAYSKVLQHVRKNDGYLDSWASIKIDLGGRVGLVSRETILGHLEDAGSMKSISMKPIREQYKDGKPFGEQIDTFVNCKVSA